MSGLGVPRGLRVDLAESLEIIKGKLIPQKMEEDVLQGTSDEAFSDSLSIP